MQVVAKAECSSPRADPRQAPHSLQRTAGLCSCAAAFRRGEKEASSLCSERQIRVWNIKPVTHLMTSSIQCGTSAYMRGSRLAARTLVGCSKPLRLLRVSGLYGRRSRPAMCSSEFRWLIKVCRCACTRQVWDDCCFKIGHNNLHVCSRTSITIASRVTWL